MEKGKKPEKMNERQVHLFGTLGHREVCYYAAEMLQKCRLSVIFVLI